MGIKKIGFIGTGIMGAAMAGHLLAAGFEVSVYNRTKAKAEGLLSQGAKWCDSPGACAKGQDAVITIVGYPKDVEEVYLEPDGIFAHAKIGAVAVDMTTSSPSLAEKLYAVGKEKGVAVLDAPVSGGDAGAKNAALTIMVGGDQEAYEKALPLFQCMGKAVTLMGGPGMGQHTKACNQICVAGATAAYTEALAYAKKAGLEPEKMLSAIAGGAAGSWQIDHMAPRALAGDHDPGFFIKHFIKDMRIIEDVAREKGLDLPMLHTVLSEYEDMAEKGGENLGTQALIRRYLG